MEYRMLKGYENRSAHYIVPRRILDSRHLGAGKKPSPATGAACPYYSDGCRRYAEPSDRSPSGCQQTNGPALAATLLGFSACRTAKGRPTSRSYPQNCSEENSDCCRSHSAYYPTQCNSLEYPKHGKGPGAERSDDPENMETAQPETSFGQNLQAQSRQTLRREALRCGGSVPQSSGQIVGLVCRRKEPDPSFGSNSAWVTDEEGSLWNHDARLQTQRYDHSLCSPQYARWQGDRRLHATPSASGIHPFSQENRRRDPSQTQPAFDRRQLRHPQASPRKVLAQTASTVPFALYSNIQFLGEPGRALVPRAYRQTHPSRHVPECARTDCCYQRLYRQSQPTSPGFCMDGTRRTDSGQSGQK